MRDFIKKIIAWIRAYFLGVEIAEEEDQEIKEYQQLLNGILQDASSITEEEREEDSKDDDKEIVPEVEEEQSQGTVTSFLWKPKSSKDGRPVILISCDDVDQKELFIKIISHDGKNLAGQIIPHGERGNKLPQDSLGRVHFRPDKDLDFFAERDPLKVLIMRHGPGTTFILKQINIPNATQRLELVNLRANSVN